MTFVEAGMASRVHHAGSPTVTRSLALHGLLGRLLEGDLLEGERGQPFCSLQKKGASRGCRERYAIFAKTAYELADAMMKERDVKTK
jgi:hypothetical protein